MDTSVGYKQQNSGPILISKPSESISLSESLREIWGGMEGKIFVLHSAWDPKRVIDRIIHELKTRNSRLAEVLQKGKAGEELVGAIKNGITRYDNFLIEGDMIALDHLLSTLRFLYNPNDILRVNSWTLGSNIDEVQKNKRFVNEIVNGNVVLLCGPLGNLATHLFLGKARLPWLFDSQDKHVIHTHPNPNRTKPLKVEVLEGKHGCFNKLHNDYGFFLRCKNPYNQQKRMYAVMGTYSYGTQGAAAFACNNDSLAELCKAPIDSEIKELGVDYIAWIEVLCEGKETLESFSDPKLAYKIYWPESPSGDWKCHLNPACNYKTQII